jgi:hypothetical protein
MELHEWRAAGDKQRKKGVGQVSRHLHHRRLRRTINVTLQMYDHLDKGLDAVEEGERLLFWFYLRPCVRWRYVPLLAHRARHNVDYLHAISQSPTALLLTPPPPPPRAFFQLPPSLQQMPTRSWQDALKLCAFTWQV